MTVVLIMIFATTIMSSILTTAKQNDIIQTDYQATHIAEMGAYFIRQEMIAYIKENDIDLEDQDYFDSMEVYLNNQIDEVEVDPEDSSIFFELEDGIDVTIDESTANITATVIGYSRDYQRDLQLSLSIESGEMPPEDWDEESEEPPPPPEAPDQEYEEEQNWSGDDCTTDSDQSFYFKDGATISCDNMETGDFYVDNQFSMQNNSSLTINGVGVFQGIDVSNLSTVTIYGDAYIDTQLTSGNNPNSEFLACGHSRFSQGIDYQGSFAVRGYSIVDGPAYFKNNNGLIRLGNDTEFKDGLTLDNADLHAGGHLTIMHNETIDAISYLNGIGGNILIAGDLTIINGNGVEETNPPSNAVNYNYEEPDFPECEGVELGEFDPDVSLDDGQY